MPKDSPIILIDDDKEDQEIFKELLDALSIPNELVYFSNCLAALDYLSTTQKSTFIIFCDINLPKLNGIEFKKQVDADPKLRKKSIPFVFYSTAADKHIVEKAYTQMTVQGFFQKGTDFGQMKQLLQIIFQYWQFCEHPNT
jgi:CheY-like chemotaxis protein